MRTTKTLIGLVLCFTCSACFQQIAVNSLSGIMDNGFEVLNEEEDLPLAGQSIASNLKLLETILKNNPDDEHNLLLASRGYSSYALGFVEDESIERAKLFYLRGRNFGLKILNRNHTFAAAQGGNIDQFRSSLRSFSHDDVPAIFWTAIGWGSYISLNLTDPASLADLPKVEAMMETVLSGDSSYYYGGAHFFLGTLYGSRSKILGGSPESSLRHFERCLEISHRKFLMAFVYYARSYAVQTQNRELFEQCLTYVDSTSLDVLPEARLSNAVAKRKAKLLREKIDQLF